MLTIILFLLALFPVIVLGYYTYSKDSEKEPKKLLIKLFLGGLGAAVLTLCCSLIFYKIPFIQNDVNTYNVYQLLFYSFIVVALVEELSKFIMTYKIAYHDPDFDQLYDMIVYAVFVSLGFAWIENLIYVLDGGISTAISRIFFSVPTHASVAVFMGYYLSLAKLAEIHHDHYKRRKNLLFSIFIPTILHGSYDYLVYSNNYMMAGVLYLFVFLLYIRAHYTLKNIAQVRGSFLVHYCSNCGTKIEGQNYCKSCGKKVG